MKFIPPQYRVLGRGQLVVWSRRRLALDFFGLSTRRVLLGLVTGGQTGAFVGPRAVDGLGVPADAADARRRSFTSAGPNRCKDMYP